MEKELKARIPIPPEDEDESDPTVQTLWAYVGVHADGSEGLLSASALSPDGMKLMVAARRLDLIPMGMVAQAIANTGNLKVELREYRKHRVFHEFTKDEENDTGIEVQTLTRDELDAMREAALALLASDKEGGSYGTS